MTEALIELLEQYGALVVSISKLKSERPGSQYDSLEDYYKTLGLLKDEHALVVRISKDEEIHMLHEGEHDVSFKDDEGNKTGIVSVWELPEDEYWFFRAFRPALFGLEKVLPSFIFEMGITHAYALFEGYLSEILRARLRRHPRLMAGQREMKYEQVFEAESKGALIESMIEREMRELMYSSLPDILQKMRKQMGFNSLTDVYDEEVTYLSLLRNCLLHNRGRVDVKLAALQPGLERGKRLSVGDDDVTKAVNALRKFSYRIDRAFEAACGAVEAG